MIKVAHKYGVFQTMESASRIFFLSCMWMENLA